MNKAGRKYSIPSTANEPIAFHSGWGMPGWAPDDPPTEVSGDNQERIEVEHRVTLSTEPAVLMGDGSTRKQYLILSPEQRTAGTAPRVLIGRNDSVGVAATVDEARQFAIDILALVDGPDV